MKHVLLFLVLSLCTHPMMASATDLGTLILSIPGSEVPSQALPDRLVAIPNDLFTEATGFRYEAIPGIRSRTPGKPEDGLVYWIPKEWVDALSLRIHRENALETGMRAGETMRIYSAPRFSGLSADLNEIVQQTLTVSLAYRASGYDTRLLDTLYLTWQGAFLQTLPAYQAMHASQDQRPDPAAIDALLDRLNAPDQIASTKPEMRLAVFNRHLFSGLLRMSRAILAERPGSQSAWKCLVMLARSRNNAALLEEALRALKRLAPENPEQTMRLAEALYEAGSHECTNLAAKAMDMNPKLSHHAQAILRGMALRNMVTRPASHATPDSWRQLVDALADEGLLAERDKLLDSASSAMKRSPGWQVHNLNRKSENILTGLSRQFLAAIMQPSGIPGILAAQRTGIQDWFAASRSAAGLFPEDPDIFLHLILSGLLASTLDGFENSMTAWNQFQASLPGHRDSGSLEAGITRLIRQRFPDFLAILRSPSTASVFDAQADRTQRLGALRAMTGLVKHLADDIDGLALPARYPRSGAAHLVGRLVSIIKTALSHPVPEAVILGVLDGTGHFSPFGSGLPESLNRLKTTLANLFAPTPSATANSELGKVRQGMESIIGLIEGFSTLPASDIKDIFSAHLAPALEGHIRILLSQNLHAPAALPWLKASVLISRARKNSDKTGFTKATLLLLDALDKLDQPPLLDKSTTLHLYNDTRQLGAIILQNLGYCLSELRHKDAAAFTGSTLRKSTTPLERVIALIDHLRVVREYSQTALVPELRQLVLSIAHQSNLSPEDRRDATWVALSWLIPYAGDDAQAIRDQIRHLGIENPLRLSTFSFGSSYGKRTGLVLYSQVTFQAFSTPETWLAP